MKHIKRKLMLLLILGGVFVWALLPQQNITSEKSGTNSEKQQEQGASVKLPGYRIMKNLSIY